MNKQIVTELAKQHMLIIRQHYLANPTSRDRVYENLNALAIAVATILQGCPDEAQEFFNDALEQQIDDMLTVTKGTAII